MILSKQGNKKTVKKSDEYITYRVVLAFIEAAIFLLLISKLQAAIDTPTTYSNARAVCLIIAAVAAVCVVAGVVSYFMSVRRETYRAGKVFNGMFLAAASLVVLVSTLILFYNHILGMRVIYMLIPASAILFLIYSVYPKTLFITSATHVYVAFACYALYKLGTAGYRLFALVSALVVCALALALYFTTAKNQGRLSIAGVRFVVFDRGTDKRYLLVLYGVTAALLVAAYLLGGMFAFYAMVATIVYMVCAVIYSTVKMM